MANSGEWLENLVKEIEANLLPKGFKVECRVRHYDDDGNQDAELDIVISGKLGSGNINWLIECRDRKSEGSAPISWIEQLVTRRNRLNFNKVTAVSASGFSTSAMNLADEQGIELRTVGELSYEEIAQWFQAQHINYTYHLIDVKHGDLFFENLCAFQKLMGASTLASIEKTEPIFYYSVTGETKSVNDIARYALDSNPSAFADIVPNGNAKLHKYKLHFPDDAPLYLNCNGEHVRITRLDLDIELTRTNKQIPISQITEYSDIQIAQTVAQSVRFTIPILDRNIDVLFHRYLEDGSSTVLIRSTDQK